MGANDRFWKNAGNVATQYVVFVFVLLFTVVGAMSSYLYDKEGEILRDELRLRVEALSTSLAAAADELYGALAEGPEFRLDAAS